MVSIAGQVFEDAPFPFLASDFFDQADISELAPRGCDGFVLILASIYSVAGGHLQMGLYFLFQVLLALPSR
jgi:hypothetical protein